MAVLHDVLWLYKPQILLPFLILSGMSHFQNWLAMKAFYSSYVIFEDVVWGFYNFWKFHVNWIGLEYVNVENWTKAPEMQVSALCGHKHRESCVNSEKCCPSQRWTFAVWRMSGLSTKSKMCNSLMPETVCRVVSRSQCFTAGDSSSQGASNFSDTNAWLISKGKTMFCKTLIKSRLGFLN